jgi:hypothetical protein
MPKILHFQKVTIDDYEPLNPPPPFRPALTVASAVRIQTIRTGPMSIDTPWSALTWLSKANKVELLQILSGGGEDFSLVLDCKSTEIAEYMVSIQKLRAAERLAEVEAETDNDDEWTTSADADRAVSVIRTKAKPNRSRDAWVKNLETTKLSASAIDDIQRGRGEVLPILDMETARS